MLNHGDTAKKQGNAFVSRAFPPCRRVAVVNAFPDFPA